jgi:phage terminase large subunit-like protein
MAAAPSLQRVVVAIDPAVTSGEDADETGIIVVGKDNSGHGYVLADASGRYQPIEWAKIAIAAYRTHHADRIVADKNETSHVELVLNEVFQFKFDLGNAHGRENCGNTLTNS